MNYSWYKVYYFHATFEKYGMFTEINNDELETVDPSHVILNFIHSKSKGHREHTQQIYDQVYNAEDIVVYESIFDDFRIGFSKTLSLYFYYLYSDQRFWVFTNFESFADKLSMMGTFSSDSSGCSCPDCNQIKLDIYTGKAGVPSITPTVLVHKLKVLFDLIPA